MNMTMAKRAAFILAMLVASSVASAARVSDADAGTYEWLGPNQAPTGVLFKLSRSGDNWVAVGKLPHKDWTAVSCGTGCEYVDSTDEQIRGYFPPRALASTDIACIQNIAQAFCRLQSKSAPERVGHVMVALVTGRPIPVLLRRVGAR